MSNRTIAIMLNAYWSTGGNVAGGDRRLKEVLRKLVREYHCTVYTSWQGKEFLEADADLSGLEYVVYDGRPSGLMSSYLKMACWAAGQMRDREYDLVYASSDFFPDVYPAYCASRRGVKWIQCVMHLYPAFWRRPGSKIRALAGYLAQKYSLWLARRGVSRWVVLNTAVGRELSTQQASERQVSVNGCGVDLGVIERVDKAPEPFDGCFVGRIAQSKGVFDLVRIWEKVVSIKSDARLCVVGGGDKTLVECVKREIALRGLGSSIEMKGFVTDAEMYGFLKASKVFLFPSHEEGFGIAVAEAMACGLPAVVWNLDVYDEYFRGGVRKVDLGNIDAFASEVARLLDNKAALGELADMARERARSLSWAKVAERECEIVAEVLSE